LIFHNSPCSLESDKGKRETEIEKTLEWNEMKLNECGCRRKKKERKV